jgi:hypothetical protein
MQIVDEVISSPHIYSIHNQTKKCGKMVDTMNKPIAPKKNKNLCTQMQAPPQQQPKKALV